MFDRGLSVLSSLDTPSGRLAVVAHPLEGYKKIHEALAGKRVFPVVFDGECHKVVLLFFLWLVLTTEAQAGRTASCLPAFPAQESFLFRLSAATFTALDLLRRIHAFSAYSPALERRRKNSLRGTADAAPSFRVVSELKKHSSPQFFIRSRIRFPVMLVVVHFSTSFASTAQFSALNSSSLFLRVSTRSTVFTGSFSSGTAIVI